MCQKYVYRYIHTIEEIVEEGMKQSQIKSGDSKAIASEIYALIASTLVYKMKNEEIDVRKLYREFESTIIEGLRVKS